MLAGWSKCDARRSLQETKQQFPGVDFSLIQSEQDTMWPRFNSFDESGVRTAFGEPEEHVTDRGIQFLHWLMTRYSCMRYSSATQPFLLPDFCRRWSSPFMSIVVGAHSNSQLQPQLLCRSLIT